MVVVLCLRSRSKLLRNAVLTPDLQELEDCIAFHASGLLAFSNGFGEGKVFELLDEVLT